MPIEFNCPQCAKRLAVPDNSAGSKAKCPQCQNVVEIPSASAPSYVPPTAVPFGQEAASTPIPAGKPPAKQPTGQIVPTAVQPGEVIEYAWEVWKRNLGILVGMTAVVFMVSIAFAIIQQIFAAVMMPQLGFDLTQIVLMLIGFVGNFIQLFLGIGQTQVVLKLLRGQHADFGELFGGGSLLLRVLGATVVATLVSIPAFLALIVPFILLILLFWPFYHLIVDHKAKAMESYGLAYPIAKLNIGTTIVLFLATLGISLAGFLALCVGLLFSTPLISTIWGAAYLMMSGLIPTRPGQQY